MKIILILLIFPYFSSSYWFDCNPCNCLINNKDIKTADCNKNYNVPNLDQIPNNIDKEIKILEFKEQSLAILRDNHFAQLANLQEIYLNKNKISSVHENSFKGLANLTKLNLEYNELSELPINIFYSTLNLTYLWLNNNKLKCIQQNQFINMKYLSEIHLQQNEIKEVSKNSFGNVPSLAVIDLSYNNLKNLQLNVFDGFKNITYLLLHANPWNCNKSLCELRETSLKNKWLTSIPYCEENLPDKSWEDLKNYTVHITANPSAADETVELICEYYSCIHYELIWTFNHKKLEHTETIDTVQKDNKLISVLTLKHVDESIAGIYTCSVFNCDECKDDKIYLNLTERPERPTEIVKSKEEEETEFTTAETTKVIFATEDDSSSGFSVSLAISISLPLILLIICCCCVCCCCRNKCKIRWNRFRKSVRQKERNKKDKDEETEAINNPVNSKL